MNSKELRQEFLKFFEKRGHKIVPSSSLIPNDPSVLFTTAGMQQFKTYYLGEKSPYGPNVVSCQKCFRTSDIEEIGDNRHLTFLEMLGNFSFAVSAEASGEGGAGYFKEKTIELAFEFLTKRCCEGSAGKLQADKLWITVFKGEEGIPEDKTSEEIWQRLGIPKERIHGFGRKDNFWGPTGEEGPCGPTTEIHYDLTGKPCPKKEGCVPNCSCERFIELWNLVFNEYFQDKNKKLTPLRQKGVDTGMGLERLAMVCQEKASVYETDLFEPIIKEIPTNNEKARRIIADHIKSAVFLISEEILPSNVEKGYILRRILRRAIRYGKLLNLPKNFLIPLAQKVIEIYSGKADISGRTRYKEIYPEIKSKETDILTVIQNEEEKFQETLRDALKKAKKIFNKKTPIPADIYFKIMQLSVKDKNEAFRKVYRDKETGGKTNDFFNFGIKITNEEIYKATIDGKEAFNLYQTYGFPIEMIIELVQERKLFVDIENFWKELKKHQEISRSGAEKKFGGGGEFSPKLHTATHLLHAALRQILGEHVKQMGSDITAERLRFDFSHSQKMTEDEIKKVEDLVNQKIKENLEVKKEEMSYKEAIESGALAFFKEKYPEVVSVYSINNPSDPSGQVFSKEICAGPHIKKTSELGQFKIIKEESSGAGIRRIRGILQ